MPIICECLIPFISGLIALTLVFAVPLFLTWKEQYQKAKYVCTFALIFLTLLNIEHVKSISIFGNSVELQEKLDKAEQIISDLKDVTLAVSTPIYDMYGTSPLIDSETSNANKHKLDSLLQKIGIPEEEIWEASKNWRIARANDFIRLLFDPQEGNDGHFYLDDSIIKYTCNYYTEGQIAPPPELAKLLEEHRVKITKNKEELLTGYKTLYDNNILKHPKVITHSNMTPLSSCKN